MEDEHRSCNHGEGKHGNINDDHGTILAPGVTYSDPIVQGKVSVKG